MVQTLVRARTAFSYVQEDSSSAQENLVYMQEGSVPEVLPIEAVEELNATVRTVIVDGGFACVDGG